LRHARNEPRQVFLACSDDLLHINLWGSSYEQAEGHKPKETYPVKDVVEVRSGGIFESAEGAAVRTSVGSRQQASLAPLTGRSTLCGPGLEAADRRDALSFVIALTSGRSLDLEAFTPDERARWVRAFQTLTQFAARS